MKLEQVNFAFCKTKMLLSYSCKKYLFLRHIVKGQIFFLNANSRIIADFKKAANFIHAQCQKASFSAAQCQGAYFRIANAKYYSHSFQDCFS